MEKASASGGLRPQTPYRGFAPGPHWGTSSPRPLTSLHCTIAESTDKENFIQFHFQRGSRPSIPRLTK